MDVFSDYKDSAYCEYFRKHKKKENFHCSHVLSSLKDPFLCTYKIWFYITCLLDVQHFSFIHILSVPFQVIECPHVSPRFIAPLHCMV